MRGPRTRGPRTRGIADEGTADEGGAVGGITFLRLVPDQLVRATGRQLGLWGDAVVSDRVARAALRVQAMLGHGSVVRPLLAGGRDPAEQVTPVPFGDAADPALPSGRPWPGRLRAGPGHGVSRPAVGQGHRRLGCRGDRYRTGLRFRGPRPVVGRRRAVADGHLLGWSLAGHRTLVASGRRPSASQIPAGRRRRERLAGRGAGRPVADRGQLRLTRR